MSGISRWPSFGIPLTPACHEGLLKNVLTPPPPEASGAAPVAHCVVQVSFHTFSGIYDFADANVKGSLFEFQYVLSWPFSLSWVPPAAIVNGVAACRLTETGPCAMLSARLSQPAAPVSPE